MNDSTILCLASEMKGLPLIEECHRQGYHVIVLMDQKLKEDKWPWHAISEHFPLPDLSKQPDMTHTVSYLMRGRSIDRIVALDDYDVATAAALREHLRLPGIGETVVRFFRDKLAMRKRARDSGIRVPEFTSLFNYDALRDWMNRVPTPWVLKPRFEAGAVGIRKLHDSEAVWRALDELGDQQSFYLLEQFVPGDVYHVDSIIWDGDIQFAVSSKYGVPPLAVTQGGGIFTTRILGEETADSQTTIATTRELFKAFHIERGVGHTEYIRAHADGEFYFLETAARVGGANIDKMVKAATGIELWQEAARIELAHIRGETYQLPERQHNYAGLITCLAKQQWPDFSGYTDPEIVWRLPKEYHAGLMLASPEADRVAELLNSYAERFLHDFATYIPPKSDARTTF